MSTANEEADLLIHLSNVQKVFARTIRSNRRRLARSVIEDILPFDVFSDRQREHEFQVLNDINLEIRRGEAVGLIGHNGAGKTTLLRILAGHLAADRGHVTVKGNVADLINLTAGFQKTLSGRDNIFIGGALRGKSRKDMQGLFDEIVDFSELHDFIDAPFGTYSQGMQMRLGFSVAVHTDPDILLIDEILAVGDLRFRNKCLGHLQKMKKNTTFVLVSHGMSQIRDFCDRAIFIEKGRVVFDGDAMEGADLYEQTMSSDLDAKVKRASSTGPRLVDNTVFSADIAQWHSHSNDDPMSHSLKTVITLYKKFERLKIGIQIYGPKGVEIVSLSDPSNSSMQFMDTGSYEIEMSMLGLNLNPGSYPTVMSVRDGPELIFRDVICHLDIPAEGGRHWGLLKTSSRWNAARR